MGAPIYRRAATAATEPCHNRANTNAGVRRPNRPHMMVCLILVPRMSSRLSPLVAASLRTTCHSGENELRQACIRTPAAVLIRQSHGMSVPCLALNTSRDGCGHTYRSYAEVHISCISEHSENRSERILQVVGIRHTYIRNRYLVDVGKSTRLVFVHSLDRHR
jgi:hypothetical protein